jgi:hypothetical protein
MTIAAIVMSLGQGFTHGFDISGGTIASLGFNTGPPNYAGQYVAHA